MSKSKYNNPFTATLNGILDLFKKQTPIGTLKNSERLDGKTCLVTGSNSGLGFAVAKQMADRGANVIMACRGGIPQAGEEIKKLTGNNKIKMLPIDLSDIDSIKRLINNIKTEKIVFDVAVFNAALVPGGSKKTKSGLEQMFLVNYLSKFILVNGLIKNESIRQDSKNPSRIIFVSSESHRTKNDINFETLGVFEEYTMSKVIELYGYYKLLLTTYANELSSRLNNEVLNTNVFTLCPGPINSNIARAAPKLMMPLLKLIFGIFFSSPTKAAEPVMYLACAKDISNRKNLYLHLMQEKHIDEKASDINNRTKLWNKSEEIMIEIGA